MARCWAKRLVWKSVTVKRVTREFLCLGDIQAALPASCYDVGMVSEIRFSQYKVTKTGLSQKAISTVPLVIEADLRTIKLGVTLGVERFAAQYKGNAWEYATKMATRTSHVSYHRYHSILTLCSCKLKHHLRPHIRRVHHCSRFPSMPQLACRIRTRSMCSTQPTLVSEQPSLNGII